MSKLKISDTVFHQNNGQSIRIELLPNEDYVDARVYGVTGRPYSVVQDEIIGKYKVIGTFRWTVEDSEHVMRFMYALASMSAFSVGSERLSDDAHFPVSGEEDE